MQKNVRFLIVFCSLAMLALLGLQAYWIVKYYQVTRFNFEKEVNMAFEDAVKKEFSVRCDTVQQLIEHNLLDTNQFIFSSNLDEKGTRIYNIFAKGKRKNKMLSSFSFSELNDSLRSDDKQMKQKVAQHFAKQLRTEDLENHVVYYRTQELGTFMVEKAYQYQFDTTRLRPILNRYLKARNIHIPYRFLTLKNDSTTNLSHFSRKLTRYFPVISKSYPTYRYTDNQRYVRAMFRNPFSYIISNMGLILISSIVLVLLIAICLTWMLKSLFREKKLAQIKNDFISNITHEFKTPIATVSVAIEALGNSEVRNDEHKTSRYLNHAKNEIERLDQLVDKVMNLSLYEDEQTEIHKEFIAIDEVIQELIQIHQVSNDKTPAIHYENKSGEQQLWVDKLKFRHAISNILDNAIKYTNSDPIINISLFKENNHLVFRFQDNGIGIPDKDLHLVFDKFYRVNKGNRHLVKGHGLGLNYVKQIMQQHKGWYKIESKLGTGTTIILGWPI